MILISKKKKEKNLYQIIELSDEFLEQSSDLKIYKEKGHQYIVNVHSDVNISKKSIKKLPLQFYRVKSSFTCMDAELETLEGCPQFVGDFFRVVGNPIKHLIGGPVLVGGSYRVHHNKLETLEGCPHTIGNFIDASYNHLHTLIYFPEAIGRAVYLKENFELLKYQESMNLKDCFFNETNPDFWRELHQLEKIMLENDHILNQIEFSINKKILKKL